MTLRPLLLGMSIFGAMSAGSAAQAVQLVVNGDFETTTMATATQMNTTNVGNWSTSGYNFIFFPGTATTTGSYILGTSNSHLTLYGTLPSGVSNGFPATSPSGGNFVAADGAYQVGAITQTISGLVPGKQYALSFLWGAGQQTTFNAVTTEQWRVSLGAETHATPIVNNPNHGFSGWFNQSLTYTATSTSEVLSFLAAGTPNGLPPFVLLDGVSLVAVTEPASWMTLLAAVAAIVGMVESQRRPLRPTRRAVPDDAVPTTAIAPVS